MTQQYEYKFVRLGEGWLGLKKSAADNYQKVVNKHAVEGWRLVQVFAPGTGLYGSAKYYELIFERPVVALGSDDFGIEVVIPDPESKPQK